MCLFLSFLLVWEFICPHSVILFAQLFTHEHVCCSRCDVKADANVGDFDGDVECEHATLGAASESGYSSESSLPLSSSSSPGTTSPASTSESEEEKHYDSRDDGLCPALILQFM
jgi:hypothetical protein